MDIRSLIDENAITETRMEVLIGNACVYARILADATEVMALEKRAKQLQRIAAERPSPAWQPFLPAAPDVIRLAVFAEAVMIDPPMTFLEGLEMAKTCGLLLAQMVGPVLERSVIATEEAEEELLADLKNA